MATRRKAERASEPLAVSKRAQRSRTNAPSHTLASQTSYLLGLSAPDDASLIGIVRDGLSAKHVLHLLQQTGIPQDQLGRLVQIPPRTMSRRLSAGRLTLDESDRVARLARLVAEAIGLFQGDEAAAGQWLARPNPALGGVTPLSLADTDLGTRAVSQLIGRLAHGIPS